MICAVVKGAQTRSCGHMQQNNVGAPFDRYNLEIGRIFENQTQSCPNKSYF